MNAAQLIELYGLIIATIVVAIIINPYNSFRFGMLWLIYGAAINQAIKHSGIPSS